MKILKNLRRSFVPLIFASILLPAISAHAASKLELDTRVSATLERLYSQKPEARALGNKAAAILVFPTIIKAGFGIGGKSAKVPF